MRDLEETVRTALRVAAERVSVPDSLDERVHRRTRRRVLRRRLTPIAVMLVVIVAAGTIVVLVSDGSSDGPSVVARPNDPALAPGESTPSSTTPSTGAAVPPTPYVAGPGSFGRFVEQAARSPEGSRSITLTLPNGQRLSLSFTEDAVELLSSLALSETFYVSCPPPDASCGDAEPTAYATESVPSVRALESFTGGDGQPVQLIERAVGRALRYVRAGWTVDVPLFYVPQDANARWSSGLIPVVNDDGWLQIDTTEGLKLGLIRSWRYPAKTGRCG